MTERVTDTVTRTDRPSRIVSSRRPAAGEGWEALCRAYREIRRQRFLDGLPRLDISGIEMREMAAQLRSLSGQFDQAGRAPASL